MNMPDRSRRRWIKRTVLGVGIVSLGIAALAVADADRADSGTPLFVRRLGEGGPLLVFLPGIGGTTRYWELVVAPLQDRFRLALVDLLGFGRSPKPWTTYSVSRHLAELERVIAPLATNEPVVLVGHSLGARLGLAYAARHPAQVRALVLVSMPYFADGDNGDNAKRVVGRRDHGWIWTHMVPFALACLLGRRLLGWAAPMLAGDLPREVAEDMNQMTWRSSTSTMWEVIYRYDLTADVLRLPPSLAVTFLHGDQDESAPLEGIRDVARLRPSVAVHVREGADHRLPLKHRAWVREQIVAAMAR
ncbi:alpha/beta hydrolase [Gemmatimonas groenlandica]|uniref:Alpha/beta hydrolase n=2 Tax=Gemmatimonas groenlandica TaxID=2732249 RepID=A0A6M4IT48_9BACT|nr:alpha/beta hydrolase [Gemmatimonas groenlandica]